MKFFSFIFFSIFLFFWFFPVSRGFAQVFYPSNTTGYDISFPQCNGSYPNAPYDFTVIGITNGKAFTHNSCLLDEYMSSKKNTSHVSLYMNINFPSGASVKWANSGPKGNCLSHDVSCQGYNYGYNAAEDAYTFASSQFISSSLWWLDVETANFWADDIQSNPSVVEGALSFFQSRNIVVGIYSTQREWTIIMGTSYIPRDIAFHPLPNWIGTGGTDTPLLSCFVPFSPGSPVWLVQYNSDVFDENFGCM